LKSRFLHDLLAFDLKLAVNPLRHDTKGSRLTQSIRDDYDNDDETAFLDTVLSFKQTQNMRLLQRMQFIPLSEIPKYNRDVADWVTKQKKYSIRAEIFIHFKL
jgi:hypothetical protein